MSKPEAFQDPVETNQSVAARIRKAEAAIAGLRANFAVWVKADLDSIGVHLAAALDAQEPAIRAEQLEALRRIAHNIKGQGGTFGCFGLSAAAGELDAALKRRQDAPDMGAVAQLTNRLTKAFECELA